MSGPTPCAFFAGTYQSQTILSKKRAAWIAWITNEDSDDSNYAPPSIDSGLDSSESDTNSSDYVQPTDSRTDESSSESSESAKSSGDDSSGDDSFGSASGCGSGSGSAGFS